MKPFYLGSVLDESGCCLDLTQLHSRQRNGWSGRREIGGMKFVAEKTGESREKPKNPTSTTPPIPGTKDTFLPTHFDSRYVKFVLKYFLLCEIGHHSVCKFTFPSRGEH